MSLLLATLAMGLVFAVLALGIYLSFREASPADSAICADARELPIDRKGEACPIAGGRSHESRGP